MTFRSPRFLLILSTGSLLRAETRVEQVPEGGLQPEVAVAGDGRIHLVYLRGDPNAAEVRYTSRKPGEQWEGSKTVNSIAGSGVATGSIRGPQLALGGGSTVHVLWNGAVAAPGGHAILWYARLAKGDSAFAPQRDLLGNTSALDGGPPSPQIIKELSGLRGMAFPDKKKRPSRNGSFSCAPP